MGWLSDLETVPIFGHVIGFYRSIRYDDLECHKAMTVANRTTLVMASAAAGTAIRGPRLGLAAAAVVGNMFDALAPERQAAVEHIMYGLRNHDQDRVMRGTMTIAVDAVSGLAAAVGASSIQYAIRQHSLKRMTVKAFTVAVGTQAHSITNFVVCTDMGATPTVEPQLTILNESKTIRRNILPAAEVSQRCDECKHECLYKKEAKKIIRQCLEGLLKEIKCQERPHCSASEGYAEFCSLFDTIFDREPGWTQTFFSEDDWSSFKCNAECIAVKNNFSEMKGEHPHNIPGKERPFYESEMAFMNPSDQKLSVTNNKTSQFLEFKGCGTLNEDSFGLLHILRRHGNEFERVLGLNTGRAWKDMEYRRLAFRRELNEAQVRLADMFFNLLLPEYLLGTSDGGDTGRLDYWSVPTSNSSHHAILVTYFGKPFHCGDDGSETRELISAFIADVEYAPTGLHLHCKTEMIDESVRNPSTGVIEVPKAPMTCPAAIVPHTPNQSEGAVVETVLATGISTGTTGTTNTQQSDQESFEEFESSSDTLFSAKQAELLAKTQEPPKPNQNQKSRTAGGSQRVVLTTAEETANHRYEVYGYEGITAEHILVRHGAQFMQIGLDLSGLPREVREKIIEIGEYEHINYKKHNELMKLLKNLTAEGKLELAKVMNQIHELLRKCLVARNRARADYVMQDGGRVVLYRVYLVGRSEYVLMAAAYTVTNTGRYLITAYFVDEPTSNGRKLIRRVRPTTAKEMEKICKDVEESTSEERAEHEH